MLRPGGQKVDVEMVDQGESCRGSGTLSTQCAGRTCLGREEGGRNAKRKATVNECSAQLCSCTLGGRWGKRLSVGSKCTIQVKSSSQMGRVQWQNGEVGGEKEEEVEKLVIVCGSASAVQAGRGRSRSIDCD